MRKLIGIILILTIATFAHAQFTTEQENNLKVIANNFDKLVELVGVSDQLKAVADTLDLETIPLQIAVLRAERTALIEARDAELRQKDIENAAAKQVIMETYEIQIDQKESDINALNSQLNP